MKNLMMTLSLLSLLPMVAIADIAVSDVKVFSGYPWQEVVIGYTISGSTDKTIGLQVSAKDNVSGETYECKTLEGVDLSEGDHVVKWKASTDGAKFKSDDVVFTVKVLEWSRYCVIDLADGTSATSYPVTYLSDIPSGGWTDEYKTTKLVLRRIEAGTFTMGYENGRSCEKAHQVALTKPFYIGVFEVTQKQTELVMGKKFSSYEGDKRPADSLQYITIRGDRDGKAWPKNNAVDETSFLGIIRAKTGIDFDLPTEAQWEYACRAGTTSKYNNGGSGENDLKKLGRYSQNRSDGKGGYTEHTTVGSYRPNAWGLYDMHGNAREWCLDRYQEELTTATDPKGGTSSGGSVTYRVFRGGNWRSEADGCYSYYRGYAGQSGDYSGFRLSLTMQIGDGLNDGDVSIIAQAMSSLSEVDTTFAEDAKIGTPISITYGSVISSGCTIYTNGVELLSSTESGAYAWKPSMIGEYALMWASDCFSMTSKVNVVSIKTATPVITPEDGTIIGEAQQVLITCEDEGAGIYYTTDGSEPTSESTSYRRFRVSGKTTVKAIAVHEGWTNSEVAVAHYALGQCPDPLIVSAGGETFSHGNVQISIDWECADGVLRYTTDGSDVTETSPEYAGAFAIDDTTTIKAKAFGETYFDSKQIELTVTREWEPVTTPLIAAAESFSGRKTMVSISCATEGATIRYTVDGSEPNSHSMRYSGAFEVRESTVVKAFAMLADYANSEVATKTITKVWGIGDSVGLPDHAFTTDGDAEWVDDESAAMRSGEITHKQTSVLRSTFVGKGRLTFELKTSCEEDLPEYMEYDRAEVWMNGALKMKQDGVHDWMPFEFDLDGASTTVEWRYVKDALDDAKYPGEDCIWVRNIVWLPELTCTTEVPVELSWIREKFGDLGSYYYDYEEKAKETAANGHKVWECYVAGEDPTDKDSRFTATIKMGADGKPIVSWKPPLNGEDADGAGIREGVRSYSVYGKQALDDAAEEWTPVAEGNEGDYRFFKVGVGMPEKK